MTACKLGAPTRFTCGKSDVGDSGHVDFGEDSVPDLPGLEMDESTKETERTVRENCLRETSSGTFSEHSESSAKWHKQLRKGSRGSWLSKSAHQIAFLPKDLRVRVRHWVEPLLTRQSSAKVQQCVC